MSYVYRFLNEQSETIYIGKSKILDKRLRIHFTKGHLSGDCYKETKEIQYIEVPSEIDSLLYELILINKYMPKYNKLDKVDDNKISLFNIENLEEHWKKYNDDLDLVNNFNYNNFFKLKKSKEEYLKDRIKLRDYNNSRGGYVYLKYQKNCNLFDGLIENISNITRIIYLSTYLDYHSNLLVKYGHCKKIEPMERRDIREILGLSDRIFYTFMKEMKEANIIFCKNKNYYLNERYFVKGDTEKGSIYIRLYKNAIKNLYKENVVRSHKILSYVFAMIPFLHYQTNKVCKNINSTNYSDIESLSFKELSYFLVSDNDIKTNLSRFKKNLLSLQFKINGRLENVLHYDEKEKTISVNPRIFWRGTDIDYVYSIEDKFYVEGDREK
nr:nucleotide excision repair endonuclease [Clostridioides sp.]